LSIVLFAFPRMVINHMVINASVFRISSAWFVGSDLGFRIPLGF